MLLDRYSLFQPVERFYGQQNFNVSTKRELCCSDNMGTCLAGAFDAMALQYWQGCI